jgi:hypothetical protein
MRLDGDFVNIQDGFVMNREMSSAGFENIYTVINFWDGIRSGIADFNGSPHYYECPFDEARDDWADYFLLHPIDEEIFRLAMEDWAIWQRWYAASQGGATTIETHPALPEDRARHTEIQEALAGRLVINPDRDIKAVAEVQRDYSGIEPNHATNPMARLIVKWHVIS